MSSNLVDGIRGSIATHPDRWNSGLLAALGVGLTVIGLTGIWTIVSSFELPTDARWWHLAPLLPACAVLLIKRRHPVIAMFVVTALFLVDLAMGSSLGMLLVFWDALYAAAYFGGASTRRWLLRSIVAVILGATLVSALTTANLQLTVFVALQAFGVLGTPYWWATAVRQKSELAELAEQRANDVQRMAELREAEILREERARMARDLHDVIAGQLSAIAIHSEAALAHEPRVGLDRETLRSVRGMSVRSLEEMRSMIVLLRGGQEPAATVGGLARMPELLAAARETGLTVEATVGELPELGTVVDQAGARILQEALTNAAKHAPRGSVTVDVGLRHGALLLEVTSRTIERATLASAAVGGLGLLTMSERAVALGGTLQAGWSESAPGAWTVLAQLPVSGAR